MEQNQKAINVLATAVAFIVGAGVGAVASYYLISQNNYQAGFDAAKALVEKSDLGQFLTPSDIRTLSGVVTAVHSATVTMHVSSNDPFQDPSLADRTIQIASSTKITQSTQKDPQVYQNEVVAYGSSASASSTAPNPTLQEKANLSNITIGSHITVTAAENIKSASTFVAAEVSISAGNIPGLPTSL